MQQERINFREAKSDDPVEECSKHLLDTNKERFIIGEVYRQTKKGELRSIKATDVRGRYLCALRSGEEFGAVFLGTPDDIFPCVFFCIPNNDKVYFEGFAVITSNNSENQEEQKKGIIEKIIPLTEEATIMGGAKLFQ